MRDKVYYIILARIKNKYPKYSRIRCHIATKYVHKKKFGNCDHLGSEDKDTVYDPSYVICEYMPVKDQW